MRILHLMLRDPRDAAAMACALLLIVMGTVALFSLGDI